MSDDLCLIEDYLPIETISAEKVAIEHLVAEGFPRENIQLVGNQRIGFDIRAHRLTDPTTGTIDVRRIVVKGYTRGNGIQLTVNGWYKTQQLGVTYCLYVLWNPLENHRELVRIHNPAEKLDHAKKEIVIASMVAIPAQAIDAPKEKNSHAIDRKYGALLETGFRD